MKRLLFLALVGCGGAIVGTKTLETTAVPPVETGRDGVHGMVLFGERAVFVSHIPMFHEPHDVQYVARVSLTAVDGKLPKGYADRLYTIAPERFRLDELLSGQRKTFRAEVFRGNFEDGGEKLGTVDVRIDTVLVSRPLEDAESDDEYYVFGGGKEWWALHRVGQAPSFDSLTRLFFSRGATAGRFRVVGEKRLNTGSFLQRDGVTLTVREAHEFHCLVGPRFMDACL